jgi:hypothetical protein
MDNERIFGIIMIFIGLTAGYYFLFGWSHSSETITITDKLQDHSSNTVITSDDKAYFVPNVITFSKLKIDKTYTVKTATLYPLQGNIDSIVKSEN